MNGPEAREQAKIEKLLDAVGFVVIPTSEGRRVWRPSGLPDLWCTHPELGVCFWWESKAPKGKLSDTQEEFIALTETAARAGGENTVPRCHVGTYADAERLVVRLGLADPPARDGWPPLLHPKKGEAYFAWHRAQKLRQLGNQVKQSRRKARLAA